VPLVHDPVRPVRDPAPPAHDVVHDPAPLLLDLAPLVHDPAPPAHKPEWPAHDPAPTVLDLTQAAARARPSHAQPLRGPVHDPARQPPSWSPAIDASPASSYHDQVLAGE
jgi:hypothetical protein